MRKNEEKKKNKEMDRSARPQFGDTFEKETTAWFG